MPHEAAFESVHGHRLLRGSTPVRDSTADEGTSHGFSPWKPGACLGAAGSPRGRRLWARDGPSGAGNEAESGISAEK